MDSEQLQILVTRHVAALRLLAGSICPNPDDAVQSAFIKLATHDTVPPNPSAWLFRVVKNEAIDLARAESRRKTREQKSSRREHSISTHTTELDTLDLNRALAKLAPDERHIVIARIWGELSFEEIATECDCSSSTAHRRYKIILNQLRESLGLDWLVEK